jgi:hypothetical protein
MGAFPHNQEKKRERVDRNGRVGKEGEKGKRRSGKTENGSMDKKHIPC